MDSILGIALLVAAVLLLQLLKPKINNLKAKIKGSLGEIVLDRILKSRLEESKYKILHNIMLPTDDGATTQIDHIVVSRGGIFVIETKSYDGWIFGDAKSPRWTATYFKRRHGFQNPLRQNYKHIQTLSACLGIPGEYFKNVIAFSETAKFKTKLPQEVMHFREVPGYIAAQSENAIIKQEQVPEVATAILEWQASIPDDIKAAHVSNLRRNHPCIHRNALKRMRKM